MSVSVLNVRRELTDGEGSGNETLDSETREKMSLSVIGGSSELKHAFLN